MIQHIHNYRKPAHWYSLEIFSIKIVSLFNMKGQRDNNIIFQLHKMLEEMLLDLGHYWEMNLEC